MGGHIKQRGGVEFLVAQEIFHSETTEMADVVLPAAVWVECDGTFTSADCRINRVRKAVEPPGEAKPSWKIFHELAAKMGHQWESTASQDIWEKEIAQNVPQEKQ